MQYPQLHCKKILPLHTPTNPWLLHVQESEVMVPAVAVTLRNILAATQLLVKVKSEFLIDLLLYPVANWGSFDSLSIYF